MQKNTRFITEVLAVVTQIVTTHFLPAVKEEPQCKTISVDRRILGRLAAMSISMIGTLKGNDKDRLDALVRRLAVHYGNPQEPQTLETVELPDEDIDIPPDNVFSLDEPEKCRAIPMWGLWTKTSKTLAVRIEGPFQCINKEGVMTCRDGYLALDADGHPYPIDRQVFERTYANERNEQIAGECLFANEGIKLPA